jgi:alpha-1,3-mannosyltransferase
MSVRLRDTAKMKHRLRTVTLLGVPIVRATQAEALAEILRLTESGEPAMLAFANAHTLELSARDGDLRQALQDSAMVLNDGLGVSLAARISRRSAFPEILDGTDCSPRILKWTAGKHWRVFLLDAAPGIAERAARLYRESFPGIRCAGTQSGFFVDHEAWPIARTIREAGIDVLLVSIRKHKAVEMASAPSSADRRETLRGRVRVPRFLRVGVSSCASVDAEAAN